MHYLKLLVVSQLLALNTATGQTRCNTGDAIYVVTEVAPTAGFSYSDLEVLLNSSIDLGLYTLPDNGLIYVSFIINCKGEVFEYQVARPIDKDLEEQLLPLLRRAMSWTPAKQLNIPVDLRKTIAIGTEHNRFEIMQREENARKRKKRKN